MAVFRWLSTISLLEWLVIGAAITWLVQRPRSKKPTANQNTSPWAIDLCVGVTVIGIVSGAIWSISWLSLLGFAAAAFGIALTVRGWGRSLNRWLRRLVGR